MLVSPHFSTQIPPIADFYFLTRVRPDSAAWRCLMYQCDHSDTVTGEPKKGAV